MLYVVSIHISNDPVEVFTQENRKILLLAVWRCGVWRLPMSAYKHDVLFNYWHGNAEPKAVLAWHLASATSHQHTEARLLATCWPPSHPDFIPLWLCTYLFAEGYNFTFEKFINHIISLLSEARHFCKDWLEDRRSVLCWRARAGARTRGPRSRWPRRRSGSASGRSRGRAWWASLWTWARSCRGSCRTAGSRRTERPAASCGCPAETHGSSSSILTFHEAAKIVTLVWSKQSWDPLPITKHCWWIQHVEVSKSINVNLGTPATKVIKPRVWSTSCSASRLAAPGAGSPPPPPLCTCLSSRSGSCTCQTCGGGGINFSRR